jgi:hypothetical protein
MARGGAIIFLASLLGVGCSPAGRLASLGLVWRRAEESDGERKWVLGFLGMESRTGFDLPRSTRNCPIGMDGR